MTEAFASIEGLLALVANPEACGARLRDLQEAEAAARRAQAELAVEREAHAEHVALTTVELERERKDLAEQKLDLHRQVDELEAKRAAAADTFKAIRVIEDQVKRAILRHAGMLDHFNEKIQSLPGWNSLDRLVGAPVDVYPEITPSPDMELTREGTTGDPFSPESTLTRAVPTDMASHDDLPMPQNRKPPRSPAARRSQRRAAERQSHA